MEFLKTFAPHLSVALAAIFLCLWHCHRTRYPRRTLALYIRFFLGFLFLTTGMAKLAALGGHDFISLIGPVWLEEKLNAYGLGLFARFVALSQIGIGLGLFVPRLWTLAAIMLVPLVSCILIITISLQWRGTPSIVAFLLLMNIYLLWVDWPKLKSIVSEDEIESMSEPQMLYVSRKNKSIAMLVNAFGVLLIIVSCFSLLWFHSWTKFFFTAGFAMLGLSSIFYRKTVKTSQLSVVRPVAV